MKKAILFLIGFLVITVTAIVLFSSSRVPQSGVINNFITCLEAGYPVMESYPRQCRTPEGDLYIESIGNALEKQDLIVLATPQPGDVVSSPLFIMGEARGPWFFEASFPARLEDDLGNLLGEVPATASGEWMTEEFVPFSAELEFSEPKTATGKLILQKDNPSGLPEHDDALWIPVRFQGSEKAGSETTKLKVFFSSDDLSGEGNVDCEKIFAVERVVPKTTAVAKAALEELLKGPTAGEKKNGYHTSLNSGITLQSIIIQNGVAKADFSKELNAGVAGSCRVGTIRAQIEKTLLQFSTINKVEISVNGETETILQP
ncbi:MAG: GerMN domain-containing protein [Anaplasmataceae bacterium]|nr:GerMN domain-containing protein [Anaplasmataceae bacterium]